MPTPVISPIQSVLGYLQHQKFEFQPFPRSQSLIGNAFVFESPIRKTPIPGAAHEVLRSSNVQPACQRSRNGVSQTSALRIWRFVTRKKKAFPKRFANFGNQSNQGESWPVARFSPSPESLLCAHLLAPATPPSPARLRRTSRCFGQRNRGRCISGRRRHAMPGRWQPRHRRGGHEVRGVRVVDEVAAAHEDGGLGLGDAAELSSEDGCVTKPSSVTRGRLRLTLQQASIPVRSSRTETCRIVSGAVPSLPVACRNMQG